MSFPPFWFCRVATAFGLSLLLFTGCDTSPAEPDNDDVIVEGVNFTTLFAPPTAAEVAAVRDDWEDRDLSVQGYEEAFTASVQLGTTPATLRIVSHLVGEVRHYGAFIVPEGALLESLPVLVYNHGGDEGIDINSALLQIALGFGERSDDFVYVIPSFRSEPIIYNDKSYLSEGPGSPWDGDVDDALALLNVALETVPARDPERIGVVGFSRGATVSLLMAARDPRIDLVVAFFGPTDFFGPYVQDVLADALTGGPQDMTSLATLFDLFIPPLQDGTLSTEQLRLELVRRSAVLFAEDLPALQLHHGTADQVVAVSQAQALIDAMEELGRSEPDFQPYLYEGGTHDVLQGALFPTSLQRTLAFLLRLFPEDVAS